MFSQIWQQRSAIGIAQDNGNRQTGIQIAIKQRLFIGEIFAACQAGSGVGGLVWRQHSHLLGQAGSIQAERFNQITARASFNIELVVTAMARRQGGITIGQLLEMAR